MRFSRWLAYPLALAFLAVAPVGVNAEDPPKGGAAPAPAKKGDDWAEIQTEWKKKIKPKRDAQFAKERAQFWETKGFKGLGLFWLGNIWELAGDMPKTIEAFEGFLKGEEGKDANRESAMMKVMAAHARMEAWEKAIAMGETTLKAYPMSGKAGQNADEMGRIYRRWGKNDKAMEMFTQAAEAKSSAGVFDLIDMHMVNGEIDKAKAVLAKYSELLKAATKSAQADMKEFLDAIGTVAPPLEGAKSPTKTPVPAKFGEGGTYTVLYVSYIAMSGLEKRLHYLSSIKNVWDKVEPWAVMNYVKWDPFQKKVVAELTQEQELELQVKVLEKESGGAQVLTLTPDLYAKFHQKPGGQKTILDPEGKFRWIRLTDQQGDYDWFCLKKALDKFTGQDRSGGAGPAEAGDGGGEAPGGAGGGGDMPGGGGDAPGEK
jgi:tetratricopeptide (TPR) repeat protein